MCIYAFKLINKCWEHPDHINAWISIFNYCISGTWYNNFNIRKGSIIIKWDRKYKYGNCQYVYNRTLCEHLDISLRYLGLSNCQHVLLYLKFHMQQVQYLLWMLEFLKPNDSNLLTEVLYLGLLWTKKIWWLPGHD